MTRKSLLSHFYQQQNKGAGRNFVSESGRFRLQISLWPLSKEQSTILTLFGRRILGQYPAAPSFPGPFVLLLTLGDFGVDAPESLKSQFWCHQNNLGLGGLYNGKPATIFYGCQACRSVFVRERKKNTQIGRTPKGAYSTRGRSRHLLETPFSEPLLRTLLRTLFCCKTHRRPPSQNPSENPFPRTLPRTFSEPFSERCVAVRPLRRAP